MATPLSSEHSGRNYYDSRYNTGLDDEAEWLKRGARDKADSVQHLLSQAQITPSSLVELGAGTGAVIAECQRRGLADNFLAIDYSASAIRYFRQHVDGIDAIQADIAAPDFAINQPIDVLLASHVVEHLEDPGGFLLAMRSKLHFRYAIIEVPLEDLPFGRLKALVRGDRGKNLAGHVQFYTRRSFEDLITRCGFEIIGSRTYLPVFSVDDLRFIHRKDRMPAWRYPVLWAARRAMPLAAGPLWTRLYYAHQAVLCRPV